VTIVGVALPSIREDLGFSESSLAWVANAYLLTYGGFLLLGGRLGDLLGHRRLFLLGIATFTLASLGAGLAASQAQLIGFRAVQGLGGAVASAVALSLIVTLFTEPAERAKAMGVYGFVAAGGGTIGVLLGGILTNALNWHGSSSSTSRSESRWSSWRGSCSPEPTRLRPHAGWTLPGRSL
jgi:MFS family permease